VTMRLENLKEYAREEGSSCRGAWRYLPPQHFLKL
jgi:hypothetical protein